MSSGSALIGYSGFVGSTLLLQTSFDHVYRSVNIGEIRGRQFEMLVCAGAPAAKWKANKEPEADRENLAGLVSQLETVRAERAVLISTVDVYPEPRGVDEETSIVPSAQAYGANRYWLEQEFSRIFGPAACVLRLPGLFGTGLRKNFIFDLLGNPDALALTHSESVFQFYNMSRLWTDIQAAVASGRPLLNLATEPVKAREVAERCFDVEFTNATTNPPVSYEMRTRYAAVFGAQNPYIETADQVFEGIREFAAQERAARTTCA